MVVPILDQFSHDEKQRIYELYQNGKTHKEIGELFGKPRRTIMKLCLKLGLHKNHSEAQKSKVDPDFKMSARKMREAGETLQMIAKKLGRSLSAVHRACKDIEIVSVAELNTQAICLDYLNGMGIGQIASKYGATWFTVRGTLVKNGIEIRKPILKNKIKPRPTVTLPDYDDSKEWFQKGYARYGAPTLANWSGLSVSDIYNKLNEYGIQRLTISERMTTIDRPAVVEAYAELKSMSKVACLMDCTVQSVKNILLANGITPTTTSDLMSGDNNPFAGKSHPTDVRELCSAIGRYHGQKFWDEHPEYVDVVRTKQKLFWSDINNRKASSARISELRRQGKCRPRRGTLECRFGSIPFGSSYEQKFIEFCEADPRIVNLEYETDLVEYEYGHSRFYIPDFRVWLSNGDFLVVETKSDWLSMQPKEREKIKAGFGLFEEKFMVVADDYNAVASRIAAAFNPVDFELSQIVLDIVPKPEYRRFFSTFHYLGMNGRNGFTVGAYLAGTLIAAATFGSITRNQIATKQGLTPSEMRELVRFCIHPDFQKHNLASWFISRATKQFATAYPDVKMLVSFADTTRGHTGTIYKAANWRADGVTNESYHYIVDGKPMHKKTVFNRAVAAGMTERTYAESKELVRIKESRKIRFLLDL